MRGKRLHKDLVDTYGGFINDIDKKLRAGLPVLDCLAKTMLMTREGENLDHLDMAILASAFMIGGVETVCFLNSNFPSLEELTLQRQRQLCNGLQH